MVSTTRLFASALLLAGLAAPALAQDVQYQLINDSGLTLMEFYTSVADEGSFGDDILGANVLPAGDTGTVTIPNASDACDRDLRFVFEDGSEQVKRANVCDGAAFTIASK
ncbi:hypothetical protein Rumeso_03754 [Rubellimicrobium mesophilum DSM 19309]|uniref:Uncharacterized protein n=1 Tax=Rubellimicrobium mesophilum DSM 19309 TaxID=442562 RepID=A0A017HJL8_9RHOB|nr:hypothetical protein [Rubellimicrobium mesophilum]EYD74697.1 hypothetical protein Rumeso_03754 [Rubellimicrobium mesophilum DSM 19309]